MIENLDFTVWKNGIGKVPFDINKLQIAKREIINIYKVPKWYEVVLCKLLGHSKWKLIDYYEDVTKEDSKIKAFVCKRCGKLV